MIEIDLTKFYFCHSFQDLSRQAARFVGVKDIFLNAMCLIWDTWFCDLWAGQPRQPKFGHLRDLHAAIRLCEPALAVVDHDPFYMVLGRTQEVWFNLGQQWSDIILQIWLSSKLSFGGLVNNQKWIQGNYLHIRWFCSSRISDSCCNWFWLATGFPIGSGPRLRQWSRDYHFRDSQELHDMCRVYFEPGYRLREYHRPIWWSVLRSATLVCQHSAGLQKCGFQHCHGESM